MRLDLGGLKAVEGRAVGIVDILGVMSEHLPALLAERRGEIRRLELRVCSGRSRGEGGGHGGGDGPQSLLDNILTI